MRGEWRTENGERREEREEAGDRRQGRIEGNRKVSEKITRGNGKEERERERGQRK